MVKVFYTQSNKIEVVFDENWCKNFDTSDILSAESIAIEPVGDVIIVMVYPYDWTYMMTPVKGTGHNMGNTGGGILYGESFEEEVIKPVEKFIGSNSYRRFIAGYSLGGIEALYICNLYHKKHLFEGAASVSGSMWYENVWEMFCDKAAEYAGIRLYFSLGTSEDKSRSHSQVRINTRLVADRMSQYTTVVFNMEPGGHFDNIKERIMHMIEYFTDV